MGLDIYFNKRRIDEVQLGQFRKVNFLVQFFETKFGMEVQNLQEYSVSKPMVEELIDLCEQVLEDNSKARELLPTMGGFFFGSTDYDEYYFDDVEYVLDYCKRQLLPEFDGLDDNEEITFQIWY